MGKSDSGCLAFEVNASWNLEIFNLLRVVAERIHFLSFFQIRLQDYMK